MRSMETTLQQLLLLLLLLCLYTKSGQSAVLISPRDSEVLINKSTYFNCSTSILSEQIHWYHNRVGENKTHYVYYKGQFNQDYADRYSIQINIKTGEYNLIIRSVQSGDAGRYSCRDDGGLGNISSAELIVLDATPTCLSNMKPDGVVGPNSCNLPLETLQLSCSVSYIGNIPLMLQWKMEGSDVPILEGITTDYSGKRATVNLTMSSAIEMDGEFFTCSTTSSQDKQLSCTTDQAKINYAVGQPTTLNITKGKDITCSANASVPCTYRWFYDNDTQHSVSYNQVLTTNRLGNHSCKASCPINGMSCTFVAMRIIVVEQETSSDNNIIQTHIKVEEITTKASRDDYRAIAGVAALDDVIYVVSHRSSEVEMFDIGTYAFKDRHILVELENPLDLTSCKLNNCLYIMDFRSATAPKYVIRVDSNGKILVQWSTGEEYGNLSVTNEENIVVACCDSRRLVIYSPDGTGRIVVCLSEDTIHPSHALKLRNNQFLICHGMDRDNIHRVCILKDNGELIKNSFERMETPSYLAMDDNGLIFVADQGNKRLIVLNSDLELKGEVASKENGLRGPQRIFLRGNGSTGKLFVVDNNVQLESKRTDGKLLVFTYDLSSH